MSNQHQEHLPEASQSQSPAEGAVEVQGVQALSPEAQDIADLFRDIERRQLDFLNEAGKSLIERISTFLAILLGASVLSNNFPPTYLKGDVLARGSIIAALLCYLLAMSIAMWTIQPRWYRRYQHNMTALGRVRDQITQRKMRGLRLASIFFLLGSVSLAILIIEIVWKITQ